KMPFPIHPHMLRHAWGLSSPMMATTHGRCSTTSGTRTSSTRSDTPKWRQTGSRTFGEADVSLGHLGAAASGRRQARDDFRFPLNHLGIPARLALRQYLLDKLNRPLDLLRRHRFDAAGGLDSHFPKHQQDKQFQKYRRLVPHHLIDGLPTTDT